MSQNGSTNSAKKIAITNVRIFDGDKIREPSTVVIDGGLIGIDETGAQVTDGKGGFLLPGLIDCHVHLNTIRHLELLTGFGVTTALDMGMNSIDQLESLRGHTGLTDIRGCGMTMTKGGTRHSHMPERSPESLVANADEATRYVTNRVAEGVDYIKVIVDVPDGPDQSTISAAVTTAHTHGKIVIAHTASLDSVRLAQEAHVDVITHSPLDKVLDEASVIKMKADHRIIVPTLSMMEGVAKSGIFPPHISYQNAHASVTALYQAGIPILAGTDANDAKGVPANIPHGESIHHELELLVAAGLSELDALKAATTLPAKYFGLGDRGVIEPGKRADLVLITSNPLEDIRATRSIERVWCGGIERVGVSTTA